MTYHCPTCESEVEKPGWMIAREAGFIAGEHCTMMANRFGRVVPCTGKGRVISEGQFHRIEGGHICEECKIYRKFTKRKVDKFGRESEVFCREENGRACYFQ